MKNSATVLYTDGKMSQVAPKDGKSFKLAELQLLVGGYIEVIPLLEKTILVVNEDGKGLGMPLNLVATMMARSRLMPGDQIVGPAVMMPSKLLR